MTQKNGKSAFAYKNHIAVDAERKLIRTFAVTPANVHDSQVLDELVDPDNEDPGWWADSAYRGEEAETLLADAGYESHICENGQRDRPLTPEQHANNRTHSKVRSRVEHVFVLPAEQHGRQTHPHHRAGTRPGEDRSHEPDLEHPALHPAHQTRARCARCRLTRRMVGRKGRLVM